MKIFVGYDIREDIAYQVCEYSIRKHQPAAQVIPLKQKELRDSGLYTRTIDPLSSTEFTFTRFLVPYLADYQGWAVFVDCDFVFIDDVAKLFERNFSIQGIFMSFTDAHILSLHSLINFNNECFCL